MLRNAQEIMEMSFFPTEDFLPRLRELIDWDEMSEPNNWMSFSLIMYNAAMRLQLRGETAPFDAEHFLEAIGVQKEAADGFRAVASLTYETGAAIEYENLSREDALTKMKEWSVPEPLAERLLDDFAKEHELFAAAHYFSMAGLSVEEAHCACYIRLVLLDEDPHYAACLEKMPEPSDKIQTITQDPAAMEIVMKGMALTKMVFQKADNSRELIEYNLQNFPTETLEQKYAVMFILAELGLIPDPACFGSDLQAPFAVYLSE